jgi:quercetin dioxygenase-like cupin family protein
MTRMQTFDLAAVAAQCQSKQQAWLEFLRVPAFSMGIYHLRAGQADQQKPHTEDEAYYVVSGRASFQIGGRREEVEPGTVIFVERNVAHRFVDVTEDLTVLVFFAPPEGSLAKANQRP